MKKKLKEQLAGESELGEIRKKAQWGAGMNEKHNNLTLYGRLTRTNGGFCQIMEIIVVETFLLRARYNNCEVLPLPSSAHDGILKSN